MDGGCQLPLGVFCTGNHVHVSFSTASTSAATNSVYDYVDGQEVELAQHIVQDLKK
jgi:hypothetical protein